MIAGIVPEGFRSTLLENGAIQIEYSEKHRVGLAKFLVLWFTGWTVAGAFTIPQFGSSWFITVWLVFWAFFEFFVVRYFLWILYGKTVVVLDADEMRFKTKLFKWEKSKVIQRKSIQRIEQFLEQSERRGNPSAWGLKVFSPKVQYLIRIQDHDKVAWLGEKLGKWSGIQPETVRNLKLPF